MVRSLLFAFLALAAAPAPARGNEQPDVVLILADDMGFSDIGCYGGEIETPVLDGLAERGLRFTQFYNAARCCPTRASLLTGLHPHQAGVGWMIHDSGTDAYRGDLSRKAVTIAEVLQSGGYGTYMSGKWHVTPFRPEEHDPPNGPLARGFERFFGTIHGAGSFYDPNSLMLDRRRIAPDEDFYYTDAIGDWGVRFVESHVREREEDPLFLYLAFTAPHWPMHAREEDVREQAGRYAKGWDALRAERRERMLALGLIEEGWGLTDRDAGVPAWEEATLRDWHERRMEVYAAMIVSMDRAIGRVLDAQRSLVTRSNSYVTNQGAHINSVVAFYKALGGGWQPVTGEDLIPLETREQMEQRTDWDGMLEAPLPQPEP